MISCHGSGHISLLPLHWKWTLPMALSLVKLFGYCYLSRGPYIWTTYNDRFNSVFLFTYPTVCTQTHCVTFLEDSQVLTALHSLSPWNSRIHFHSSYCYSKRLATNDTVKFKVTESPSFWLGQPLTIKSVLLAIGLDQPTVLFYTFVQLDDCTLQPHFRYVPLPTVYTSARQKMKFQMPELSQAQEAWLCFPARAVVLKCAQIISSGACMVYQKYSLGLSNVEIARRFNVDHSAVSRVVQLFEETDTVCSIQGYHEKNCKKLSAYGEFTAIINQPSHHSLCTNYNTVLITTGNDLSIPTICKYLHKQHFSRKS